MSFRIGDIVYFTPYYFTDTGFSKDHFALVLLPENLTGYSNNIYCAVLTSKKPRLDYFCVTLSSNNYLFFSKETYIDLTSQDLQSLSDLRDEKVVVPLSRSDLISVYRKLKKCLFVPSLPTSKIDPYLRATILREWKKIVKQ